MWRDLLFIIAVRSVSRLFGKGPHFNYSKVIGYRKRKAIEKAILERDYIIACLFVDLITLVPFLVWQRIKLN